ncbi:SOS response-associated peptidase [Mastigocladopsis repens]|uniref:SOS response-associated peptidase n=1 Tax=Mastigocladopsis repens TaxID=221287 RepID=UPI0003191FF3|nr:SOS response-associated peptidase [Mastigocladopsis repens]
MCGRFTLSQTPEAISQTFQIEKVPDLEPQYNIAPTQMVTAVLCNPESAHREFQKLRWGLIPSWAKDPGMGAKLFNARAETVAEKPAFRSAFKRRRCLVVADGFYEWQHQEGKKQPFYFCLQNGKPFGFAGLWEQWQSPAGEEIASCTILTTQANELLQPIHERMPVILQQQDYDVWLDPQVQTPERLQQLLYPYPSEAMTAYPVSTVVNSPKHNSPDCIQPVLSP